MNVLPKKKFTCPHCDLQQTRIWPHESINLCNRCQRPMDESLSPIYFKAPASPANPATKTPARPGR
jgi:hypothetical protein